MKNTFRALCCYFTLLSMIFALFFYFTLEICAYFTLLAFINVKRQSKIINKTLSTNFFQ